MSEHSHHHHHHHEHGSESGESPSQRDKLKRIVDHWIHHNDDHASSYQDWARRAREMGEEQVAQLLEEVRRQSDEQNRNLKKALELLKG